MLSCSTPYPRQQGPCGSPADTTATPGAERARRGLHIQGQLRITTSHPQIVPWDLGNQDLLSPVPKIQGNTGASLRPALASRDRLNPCGLGVKSKFRVFQSLGSQGLKQRLLWTYSQLPPDGEAAGHHQHGSPPSHRPDCRIPPTPGGKCHPPRSLLRLLTEVGFLQVLQ